MHLLQSMRTTCVATTLVAAALVGALLGGAAEDLPIAVLVVLAIMLIFTAIVADGVRLTRGGRIGSADSTARRPSSMS